MEKKLAHRTIVKRRKPKFRRQDWHKISSLGLRRRKKQVWRKPKGRHSKLRQKHAGHIKMPSIGYSSPSQIRGTIAGLKPVIVHNLNELHKVKKDEIAVIASIGMRKKIEIAKKISELNIKANFDVKKFLAMAEEKLKIKAERKKKIEKQELKKETEVEKKEIKEQVIPEAEKVIEEIEEEKVKELKKTPAQEKHVEKHVEFKEKKLVKRVTFEK